MLASFGQGLTGCAKRKLGGVVDSVQHFQGCGVLDGELTHKYWDKSDSEKVC